MSAPEDDTLREEVVLAVPVRDAEARLILSLVRDRMFADSLHGPAGLSGPAKARSWGRYAVIEEVGRGAMGRVMRAYDPKLQREVALKEVRPQALELGGTRRLVVEARAMARLSHPNVVAVYDVDELDDDRVVIVMEYVAGATLVAWVREAPRTWQAIVDRFRAAGAGLAAAHAAGLLHRDFKPANVLVSTDAVKVTDFGLAKQADGAKPSVPDEPANADADGTASDENLTAEGTVVGTPRYMAPEQHAGEPLSAAADQYSFCVALWEALCGEPPFLGNDLAASKRRGPPPWPNAAVPRTIADAVRRGLAPVPADRWPAMDPLLDALTVNPHPRRMRAMLAVTAVGLAVGVVGWRQWADAQSLRCTGASERLAGIWDDARRHEVRAAIEAADTSYGSAVWERIAGALDRRALEWTQMHTEACEATTVRGEQSTEVMDLRMACLHRANVELGAAIAVLASADAEVVRKAPALVAALGPLARCADVEALRAEVPPPLPEERDAVESIRSHLAAAAAARAAGRVHQAKAAVDAAGAELDGVDYGPVQFEVALERGATHEQLGEFPAAEQALRTALEVAASTRQPPMIGDAAARLLHVVAYQQRRFDEGLQFQALAMGLAQGDPLREANVLDSLAAVYAAQGKYDEADVELRRSLALYEAALGPDDVQVAASRNNLAVILERQGNYEEAEVQQRRVIAIYIAALGPDHPDVATSRSNLGGTLYSQGKNAEAEAEFRGAIAALETALGPMHPDVGEGHNNLALALNVLDRHDEAEVEIRHALAIRKQVLGPDHPEVAASLHNLALILRALGRYDEAEAAHLESLAALEKSLGPEHPVIARSLNGLGSVYAHQKKFEASEAAYRRAAALLEKALGAEHPDVAVANVNLVETLLDLRKVTQACEVAERTWAQREQLPVPTRAMAAFALARARWERAQAGDRAAARGLVEAALGLWASLSAGDGDDARTAREWLAAHAVPSGDGD